MKWLLYKKINKWLNEESYLFDLGFFTGLGLFTFYIFAQAILEVFLFPINNWITLFIIYPISWIGIYGLLGRTKSFNLGFYVGSIFSLLVLILINFRLASLL